LIIPDAWRAGLAVLALRMASRRCFLTAIAVLALAILLVAMAAASGSSAQAAADALLIDTDTVVAFGSISGEASGTLDVGTTPEGTAWFRAAAALQFARGFVNPEHAKNLLSKMLSEDGVPDGFRKGLWKVGAAKREAGKGSWSFLSLSRNLSLSLSLWVCLRVSQGAVMPCSRAQTKTRGNPDRGTRVPAVHSTHPAAACMLPVRFNSKPQSWCCWKRAQ
jgi:hypothetical protein